MKHARTATILALAALLLLGGAGTLLAQDHEPNDPTDVPTDTAPTETPSDAAVEKKLKFLLSGYEYFPTRADLDDVADADVVSDHLRRFASNEDGRPSLRLRAVDALGYYDDEPTVAYLRALVDRPTSTLPTDQQRVGSLMRHHAMTALAKSIEEESVDDLKPFLEGDDLQLRLTTIHALGKHAGEPGRTLLKQHLEAEEHPMAKREIGKFVR